VTNGLVHGSRIGRAAIASAALTLACGAAPGGGPARAARHGAAAAGTISTVAGGVGGPGPATGISVTPCGLKFAQGSSLYVSDGNVRSVDATGNLTTLVGTGAFGPAPAGTPAAKADIDSCGVAADHQGNLVIADLPHRRVEVEAAHTGTFYGQATAARPSAPT
jgi:hypothetical protein